MERLFENFWIMVGSLFSPLAEYLKWTRQNRLLAHFAFTR